MPSETILVTGGTGFIGGRLVKRLVQENHRVRAVCLPDDPNTNDVAGCGADVVEGDITDIDSVRRAARSVDRIFHCAGVVTDWAAWERFEQVHVGGMRNLLQAAVEEHVQRFVWISTNDVFGPREGRILTEDDELWRWGEPYPDTKIAAERLAWRAFAQRRLPVSTVYPCWVYGPGDTTFVPLLAEAIRDNEMLFWRRGSLVWPAYVDNVVDLLLRIGWDDRAIGEGYLVHDAQCVTLQDFCGQIAQHLGVPAPRLHIPYGAAEGVATVLEALYRLLRIRTRPLLTTYTVTNLGSRLRFSIDKARRELGWTPPVSFTEGFERAMLWLADVSPEKWKTKVNRNRRK